MDDEFCNNVKWNFIWLHAQRLMQQIAYVLWREEFS